MITATTPATRHGGQATTGNSTPAYSGTGGIVIDTVSADRFAIKVNWRARNKDMPQETEICRPYYELWLQYTGRLDWSILRRGDDTPQNIIGTMAADDYWENAAYEVKLNDLVAYILKEVLAQRALS